MSQITADPNLVIDDLQRDLMSMPKANCQLVHRFTPGLYVRELTMPAGSIITSEIHRTEHPFTISKGRVSVAWVDVDGTHVREFAAPYTGVTMPGTRRVLFIHEETIWTTYHPIEPHEQGHLEAIRERIIQPRYEHLAGLEQPDDLEKLLAGNHE